MSTKNSSILTKRYRQVLSAVHMVYRLVNSTYNVKELSLRLTRLLCQFISANSSSIYILEPGKNKIVLVANFDNKINTLLTKKSEFNKISEQEKRAIAGFVVFEKHLIALPMVADEIIGAIVVRRLAHEPTFNAFDKDMLSVVGEQSVTAIKNLHLHEDQQKTILGSMHFMSKLLRGRNNLAESFHAPIYYQIAKGLAQKLNMGQDSIQCLYYASILHDAGVLDVPYEILSKTSQLSPEEFKIIKTHPKKSADLIKPVEFLKPILPFILYHREQYDGTGYPSGLKNEQIPLGARIMAVVDAFEAMIRERPYKKKLSVDEAIHELNRNSGTQFDPKVIQAFTELSLQKKFRKFLSSMT